MSDWHTRKDCRLCGSSDLSTVLDLAPTPPANEFVKADAPPQELIPLYLSQCGGCGHVQLPVVVNPERLFRNYVYVSGTSPAFVEHFRRYAAAIPVERGALVVELGSNDGTLLRFYRDAGAQVLGVDPAKDIAARATQSGIETWPEFFTGDTADKARSLFGPAALVLANNVFAHADDLAGIATAVRKLLAVNGLFVFEVQYLVDLVERGLFDMVYHEHLSYHHLAPLVPFFDALDMTLVDAEHVETHGGSIRCVAVPHKNAPQTERLRGMLKVEQATMAADPFGKLRKRIDDAGEKVRAFLDAARSRGDLVAAYGAPAKATTMSHQFGIRAEDIRYVVDDSPWKQGLLTPGTRIPVVSSAELDTSPPDAVFLFAWNFADQIIAKRPRDRFVVPLPTFREVQP